jgi:hypothetical protein
MDNIFDQPKPQTPPQNFVDKNSISYRMKDILTWNDYEFLSNLKITEITNKADATRTSTLLQKLLDAKVFDEPTLENVESIFNVIHVSDDIKNEAAGYSMKVIIDGDDDSSARFAWVDENDNEVEVPGQKLPDSSTIVIDPLTGHATGEGLTRFDVIRRY